VSLSDRFDQWVAGTTDGPTFRMMLLSRDSGQYLFVIGRSDRPGRVEESLETFATLEEAEKAGCKALEIRARWG
jgi:hypothetical protein